MADDGNGIGVFLKSLFGNMFNPEPEFGGGPAEPEPGEPNFVEQMMEFMERSEERRAKEKEHHRVESEERGLTAARLKATPGNVPQTVELAKRSRAGREFGKRHRENVPDVPASFARTIPKRTDTKGVSAGESDQQWASRVRAAYAQKTSGTRDKSRADKLALGSKGASWSTPSASGSWQAEPENLPPEFAGPPQEIGVARKDDDIEALLLALSGI